MPVLCALNRVMLKLKHHVLALFILWMGTAAAQLPLSIKDAVSGEAVAFAHIHWQPIDGPAGMALSAMDGTAHLPIGEDLVAQGVVLRITYIGYEAHVDTVLTLQPIVVQLKRSAHQLQELVVTGQYAPSSTEKAVHRVRVLGQEQFKRMAAQNLGDALRNELNIRLSQDNILGSSLTMQGLSGENVKILVDGVPVIGRMNGNIDLAQIDLTGIERAEIVEGPLSVNYGTNALAGTINLITRKGSATPSLKASVYTEHIGRLNTSITASRRWGRSEVVLGGGRNFFAGWDPSDPGIPSFSPQLADTSRYQQWKPREQYFGRLNYRWIGDRWTFGYKGELMNDLILNRGRPRAPYYETAFDEEYRTQRIDNALFAEGRSDHGKRITMLAAHNRYARVRNTWFRDLTTLGEQLAELEGMQDTTRFTLNNVRLVFSSAPDSSKLSYELGTDLNLETGAGERIGDGEQSIGDYAIFGSLEYQLTKAITVRPGVRAAYNSRYGAPVIPSINMRWRINDNFTWRASYAQGFRAPSLKELYFFFVDVNHDIVGNEDLAAERSDNYSSSLAYSKAKEKSIYKSEVSVFHNRIADLITLAQVDGTRYSYINVGRSSTIGGTIGASWDNSHWLVSIGGGTTGRKDDLAIEWGGSYLFTPELRGSITRQWKKKGWSASVFWKYQGELSNYTQLEEGVIGRSFIAPYHMADATITKQLWGERLAISLGCKDLFNVQNVQAAMAGGVHTGGTSTVPMTTGRTYFLRLELDLKKKID
jgi:outer membrane receptor for ferrienterochelin and colicins